MSKEQYEIRTDLLKITSKFNKTIKNCADYFIYKYYKRKAQCLPTTVKDL